MTNHLESNDNFTLCTDSSSIFTSIVQLREDLLDVVEPNFGLLDVLVSLRVLTGRQRQEVDSVKAVYRKNAALIECLKTEDQCLKFLEALKKTKQQHVVNFITKRGAVYEPLRTF